MAPQLQMLMTSFCREKSLYFRYVCRSVGSSNALVFGPLAYILLLGILHLVAPWKIGQSFWNVVKHDWILQYIGNTRSNVTKIEYTRQLAYFLYGFLNVTSACILIPNFEFGSKMRLRNTLMALFYYIYFCVVFLYKLAWICTVKLKPCPWCHNLVLWDINICSPLEWNKEYLNPLVLGLRWYIVLLLLLL